MFSASKTVAVFVALAGSIAVTSAAPITATVTKSAPASYATGYLESYQVYHSRYRALNCSSHRNGTSVDDFFEDCCRPLLATEVLEEARASYCIPSNSSISSASSADAADASATATDSAAAAEYSADATSTYTGIEATTTAEVAQALVTSTSETPSSTYVEPTSTYVAPTTTSEAPAATTTAASSGGSWNGDAHATYYLQGGNAGACGNYNSDSSYIIALPYSWYGNNGGSPSQYCGKQVEIQRLSSGATVTATVADLCPSCTTSNSLDLSVGAFTAIASESEGQVDIQWKFV